MIALLDRGGLFARALAAALAAVVLVLAWPAVEAAAVAGAPTDDWSRRVVNLVVGLDHPALQFLLLALATLVSEDLTAIAAGLLLAQGVIGPGVALGGTATGIWLGDLGLWGLGRLAGPRLVVAGWVKASAWERWGARFRAQGWLALVASRVVPGMRLPLYTVIGALPGTGFRFAAWTAVLVAVWTPLVVLGAGGVGGDLLAVLDASGLPRVVSVPVALALLLVVVHLVTGLATRDGREALAIRFQRLVRHEFWPAWLLYLPLIPWFAWLALRHRGLLVLTAANPGFPHGGFVGERKTEIQGLLPEPWAIPGAAVPPGPFGERANRVAALAGDWGWPLILKPDAGQRGRGVRRVADLAAASAVLSEQPGPLLAQPWHPGPYEAGIFYYRFPGQARGRIFSINRKLFPVLVGDGRSSLDDLLRADPRLRLQLPVFRQRLAGRLDEVLAAGTELPLAVAGNHAQGTVFRDGADLVTPALEARIDAIAQAVPGFHIGRFDVRYRDQAAFTRGEDLAIVELNGVTSESTNIYDPDWPLWRSLWVLARQWGLVYAIGAANRDRGVPVSRFLDAWHDMLAYYRERDGAATAD